MGAARPYNERDAAGGVRCSVLMKPETRHSFLLVRGTALTAVLGLAYTVLVARRMGAVEYADFIAAVNLAMFGQVAMGPIHHLVTRFTAEYQGQGAPGRIARLHRCVLEQAMRWGVPGALVAAGVLTPLANVLQFATPWPVYAAVGVVLATLLISVPRGVLRGAQAFGAFNLSVVSEAAARLAVGLLLVSWTGSVVAAVGAYVLAMVIVWPFTAGRARAIWGHATEEAIDPAVLRRFVGPLLGVTLTTAGFLYSDMLAVKYLFPPEVAGSYGVQLVLANLMGLLVTPFSTVLLPAVTARHVRGEGARGVVVRAGIYIVILVSGPLVVYGLLPRTLLRTLFGAGYVLEGEAPVLLALALVRLLTHLGNLVAMIHVGQGRFRFLWVYVLGLVVEWVVMLRWHGTLTDVVWGLVAVQGMTLVAMSAYLLVGRAPRLAD